MDEILNGTSPEEHTALEWSIIRYLIRTQTPSILATHDRKLQSLEVELPGVVNIHVDEKGQQSFTVKSGPSLFRNAIQVTRDAGLPAEITSEAEAYLSQHQ
jgi:DNA mismatch repair ATPase MutS